MSKSPQYPIAAAGELGELEERRRADSETPPSYAAPSFKFRHELREPLENGVTSYYRAYPQFRLRPISARQSRRHAIRGR
jgi:hypothetical protein